MAAVTVPLTEERLAALHKLAAAAGLSPEEFLRRQVELLLEPSGNEPFRDAAAHVLRKNAELHRRLA